MAGIILAVIELNLKCSIHTTSGVSLTDQQGPVYLDTGSTFAREMNKRFKCCKNKEFVNYCCIACLNVFHPACLERLKNVVKLGGYKIFCSVECQSKDDAEREKLATHIATIQRLENECQDKDLLISRLRRQSQQFVQEVAEAEVGYVGTLAKKDEANSMLRRRLAVCESENSRLLLEIHDTKKIEQRIKNDLDELTEINKNMVTSIRVLEQENEVCMAELVRVMSELAELRRGRALSSVDGAGVGDDVSVSGILVDDSGNSKSQETRQSEPNLMESEGVSIRVPPEDAKKRLLILCDQTGYGIGSRLNRCLPGFSVQSIIKPYALYERVVEDVVKMSDQFGGEDCILVMAGVNNFINGKCPSFRELNSRLKYVTHTNVVLTSIPFKRNAHKKHANLVSKYNAALKRYAAKLDTYAFGKVSFLDLSNCSKSEVTMRLSKGVRARKKAGDGNLIFIHTSDMATPQTGSALVAGQLMGGDLGKSKCSSLEGCRDLEGSSRNVIDEPGDSSSVIRLGVDGVGVAVLDGGENVDFHGVVNLKQLT